MINVIALTQLAFITLGMVLTRILYRATGSAEASSYHRYVVDHWYWIFAIPVIWIGYAHLSAWVNTAPLSPPVAKAVGVVIAVASFVFFATSTFVSVR